jgi:YfiH family protein
MNMAGERRVKSEKLSGYASILFGMSTRSGGISPEPLGMNLSYSVGDDPSNVKENRRRFFSSMGFDEAQCAIPHQCHSNNVQIVTRPGAYDSCDGLVTDTPGLPLVVSVADCMPVVLYDPAHAVLGLIHAGWRGTAHRIVAAAVGLMVRECGASADRIISFLGPSAGVCCYEVGEDVAAAFALDEVEHRDDHVYLDLKKANRDQLLSVGVNGGNIESSSICTICTPQLFHSHRRDRSRSGRMMAVVALVSTVRSGA